MLKRNGLRDHLFFGVLLSFGLLKVVFVMLFREKWGYMDDFSAVL
jgi:hypothetical protein